MKKITFYAVAGATSMLLFGCQDTVMQKRNYIPAPETDPSAVGQPVPETVPETVQVPASKTAPTANVQRENVPVVEFSPMTDVKSSGGVDHAPRSRKARLGKSAHRGENISQLSAANGTYRVRPGDYPERIARKFRVSVSAFLEVNHLDQNSARKLQVGQLVKIPKGSVQNAHRISKKSSVKKPISATADKEINVGNSGTYVVRAGDNPYTIAKKFRIKRIELLKINGLTEASAKRLKVGQKLKIPRKSHAVIEPVVASNEAVIPPPVAVQPAEPAETPSKIAPPAPVPPVVDSSDAVETVGKNQIVEVSEESISAADFASKHGMTLEEFQKLNPGKGSVLNRGNVVFVSGSSTAAE